VTRRHYAAGHPENAIISNSPPKSTKIRQRLRNRCTRPFAYEPEGTRKTRAFLRQNHTIEDIKQDRNDKASQEDKMLRIPRKELIWLAVIFLLLSYFAY
jgi:hypothetical protein